MPDVQRFIRLPDCITETIGLTVCSACRAFVTATVDDGPKGKRGREGRRCGPVGASSTSGVVGLGAPRGPPLPLPLELFSEMHGATGRVVERGRSMRAALILIFGASLLTACMYTSVILAVTAVYFRGSSTRVYTFLAFGGELHEGCLIVERYVSKNSHSKLLQGTAHGENCPEVCPGVSLHVFMQKSY